MGGKIPDVEICMEIPFVDGAEGSCGTTVSKKNYIIKNQDWVTKRPKMIMIEASEFHSKIKVPWKESCRVLGEQCNLHLKSVEEKINYFDSLLKKYFEGIAK